MSALKIYGASDDLIEIEGDIREEFYCQSGDESLLAIADGTLLRIAYDNDGVWRITPVVLGLARVEILQAPANDDTNYSDVATVTTSFDTLAWVAFASKYARRK